MKPDVQLRAEVLNELRREPTVDASQIGVAVKDGVVTLTGQVASYRQRHAAEQAIKRIDGVKSVADELDIKLTVPMRTEI